MSYPHNLPLNLVQLLESSCAGTIMVDRACRITWISANYRRLLELPEELDPYGQEVEALIPHSLLRQVVTSGQPQLLDLMRFKERWFVVTRLPLIDYQGELQGALGMVFFDQVAYLRPVVEKYTRLQDEAPRDGERQVRYSFDDLIGTSGAMLSLRQQALRAAATDSTLLLQGETGTGKEIIAQAVHAASHRANGPFVGVNTAALPEALVEAELFGAAPGAYTGADRKGRRGKFELAQGGTLFLDEIGEMSAAVQSKLLRALQERKIEPLGSNQEIAIDVRVIAATSRDLDQLVAEGRFRADLYYRLNVLPLALPPLRQRGDDIILIAERLNRELAARLGVAPLQLDPRFQQALREYPWPGNIRELRNVIERGLLFAEQGHLPASMLATFLPGSFEPHPPQEAQAEPHGPPRPLAEQLAAAERNALQQALLHTRGNRRAAASLLGISRASFYDKLNKHRLN